MDIALEIMRMDGISAGNGGWSKGDVVRVFEPHLNLLASPQCNLKLKSYIIITGAPPSAFVKIKRWLEKPEDDGEELGKEFPKKRELSLKIIDLTPAMKQKLSNPPYTLVTTWTKAKNAVLTNKVSLTETTIDVESSRVIT